MNRPPALRAVIADDHTLVRTGFQLIGLRNGLAAHGGELTTGPTPTGGYPITARIPWQTP
ncbi:hypothetical protein [Streptomyces sp. A30]|uniref:hypothetical protein n=1 Tax=Streptomyces sp. A30 TaxID=2789273 RepID=UPI0039816D1B